MTRIFARTEEDERQLIVYAMQYEAAKELAMILPLPVAKGSGERSVRFINLEKYTGFFDDMKSGWPIPPTKGNYPLPLPALGPRLEVVSVGAFEASFVPTVADFSRLDPRFVLPADTWKQIPAYRDYGFAVFKLKPGRVVAHPMAFSFPRADRRRLFFPTVHIHDRKVHPEENFDHILYCQSEPGEPFNLLAWDESPRLAKTFMKIAQTHGIIAPDRHCYRRFLSGKLPNQDTWIV